MRVPCTGHSLAPSRHWCSITYPRRMESWASLGKNEVAQIFKSWHNWDQTGDFVVGRQRSYQLCQPWPPKYIPERHVICYGLNPIVYSIISLWLHMGSYLQEDVWDIMSNNYDRTNSVESSCIRERDQEYCNPVMNQHLPEILWNKSHKSY